MKAQYLPYKAAIGQLGGRQTEDLEVPGSIPGSHATAAVGSTNKRFLKNSKNAATVDENPTRQRLFGLVV